jgi:uroporphyrinogen-III synthase
MRLLVTRPEPDGERTAAKLRARGCEVLLAPLLRVEFLPSAALGAGPWQAVAMTSANAALALRGHPRTPELRKLPAYVVGRRTAAAARAAGFADVTSADRDVDELARLLAARLPAGAAILYLAGENRSGDLVGDLARIGVAVTPVIIYRAVKAESLPTPVKAALAAGAIGGVLHFSRRSADVYLECARLAGLLDEALNPFHYCLSPQVADPLERAGAGRIMIASRPEEAALIELVISS